MEESPIPASLNPDYFPAKLWQLVNNPQVTSVRWDDRGEGLCIDEHLFLREVLEPEGADSVFKTKSFPSFIRQLNLYGFHKVAKQPVAAWTGTGDAAGTGWFLHHFCNPHFQQHRPELLVHIKRLTKANKEKLEGVNTPHSRGQPKQSNSLIPAEFSNASSSGLQTAGLQTAGQPLASQPANNQAATSTPAQSNSVAPAASFDDVVAPTVLYQWPLNLLQGNGAHSTFKCYGVDFTPRVVTQVTYTVRPVCSVLPPHEWSRSITNTLPSSSESASALCSSSADAPQISSPPAQTDPLTESVPSPPDTDLNFSLFQTADKEYEMNAAVVDGNQFADEILRQFVDAPKAKDRKRKYSLTVDDSSDLHLLEGPPPKRCRMDNEETGCG